MSISSQPIPSEEERFAHNTGLLAKKIEESVIRLSNAGYTTANPAIIKMASLMLTSLNKTSLIQGFIQNSHANCWDWIKTKNEKYFVDNAGDLFSFLPVDKLNLFQDLYRAVDKEGNGLIPQELKDEIWFLLGSMVKISIKYIHRERRPQTISSENGPLRVYNASFFPDVDVQKHASTWEISLPFPEKI